MYARCGQRGLPAPVWTHWIGLTSEHQPLRHFSVIYSILLASEHASESDLNITWIYQWKHEIKSTMYFGHRFRFVVVVGDDDDDDLSWSYQYLTSLGPSQRSGLAQNGKHTWLVLEKTHQHMGRLLQKRFGNSRCRRHSAAREVKRGESFANWGRIWGRAVLSSENVEVACSGILAISAQCCKTVHIIFDKGPKRKPVVPTRSGLGRATPHASPL